MTYIHDNVNCKVYIIYSLPYNILHTAYIMYKLYVPISLMMCSYIIITLISYIVLII